MPGYRICGRLCRVWLFWAKAHTIHIYNVYPYSLKYTFLKTCSFTFFNSFYYSLIEIIEGIEECKRKNTRGALLSLDIRKAFDTLSHPFIEQVLNFFEFGNNFKKWVKILCTNRKACIILEGGKTSRTFNLLRGNAQGDILSPFIFILCYQI